jgi:ergot alkaloid biosynthesis protein
MRDQILITGGTGKTGSRLAQQLTERGAEFRVASRSPQSAGSVRFDWRDATTFALALEDVRAVYLVAPTDTTEPLDAMQPFLENALTAGVERFVLLSASMLEADGPMMGQVHGFLKRRAPQWNVLRPTWFMQNFPEGPHTATIREEGIIYSATGQGRVPFIDANDIARCAASMLLDQNWSSGDMVLTGPQTLSYDDVAQMLSETLGRSVDHRRLSEAQLSARLVHQGLPPDYAQVLAAMDTAIARGAEDRVTGEVQRATGCEPLDFRSFAAVNRKVWEKRE